MTLLHLIGRALREGATARAVWMAWSAVRDEDARRAEWQQLTTLPAEGLRKQLAQAVMDLADDGRQELAAGLGEVLRALRRAPLPESHSDLRALLPDPTGAKPPPPSLELRVIAGPHAGRRFSLPGHDTFLAGRSKQAHLHLGDDRYFSRVHFLIETNPPRARLVDMGSHNGTRLNGVRVAAPVLLAEGDRIQAGHTVLAVAMPGMLALEAPPPPPPPPPPPTATGVWRPAIPLAVPCRGCNPVAGSETLPLCDVCRAQALAQVQVLPGYEIIKELGRGGMGIVYLAMNEADGSVVAVKTIVPALAGSPEQVERFLREARILQSLNHPNIVRFRDVQEANGLLFFAMDYVPGQDANALVRDGGPLGVRRGVRLLTQVLLGLEHAHARKFVHRDLKPGNILVTKDGGEERAVLADFGLARVYQASQMSGLTMTGHVGGTPAYMAPEQVTNYRDARPAADQYAAAATLYYLLTGATTHDFADTTQGRLVQLLHEDAVPIRDRRPDLPDGLAQAVHRALNRDPARRFADVRAFRRVLEAFG